MIVVEVEDPVEIPPGRLENVELLSEAEIEDRALAAELVRSAKGENIEVLARTGWNGRAEGCERLAEIRQMLMKFKYSQMEIDLLVREVGLVRHLRAKEAGAQ